MKTKGLAQAQVLTLSPSTAWDRGPVTHWMRSSPYHWSTGTIQNGPRFTDSCEDGPAVVVAARGMAPGPDKGGPTHGQLFWLLILPQSQTLDLKIDMLQPVWLSG